MTAAEKGFVFIEETVPGILLAVLVAVVAWGVTLRYVFDNPVAWANELATALFVWQLFLAAGGAARHHMHLGVDALVTRLPGRWRAAQEVVVNAGILVVLGFFMYLAWLFSLNPTKVLQMIDLSYRWIYAAVPVGFGLVFIHVAADLVKAARGLVGGRYAPPPPSIEAYTEGQTDTPTSAGVL